MQAILWEFEGAEWQWAAMTFPKFFKLSQQKYVYIKQE